MKCLIADKMHEVIVEKLEAAGVEVIYEPDISAEQLKAKLPHFDGLVVRSKVFVDEQLLGDTNLKFVARAGAGVDNLDEPYLKRNGITIYNAPEGNQNAVADHVVGLLLGLTSYIIQANDQVRQSIWDREGNRGVELKNRVVGLLGYGHMGHQVAKRLAAFGCKIIAYDKYKTGYGDQFTTEVSMDELWQQSEIFSIHVPLTDETHELVDAAYLQKFKKPIWFINTARGKVVKTPDLCDALKSGKVRGAALDVLETEKMDELKQKDWFRYLVSAKNVILTPHVAGWSVESYKKISEVLAEKIISGME